MSKLPEQKNIDPEFAQIAEDNFDEMVQMTNTPTSQSNNYKAKLAQLKGISGTPEYSDKEVTLLIQSSVLEVLSKLQKNAHGGGNFRRLIEEEKARWS